MQLVINTRGTSLRRRGERFALELPSCESVQLAASKVQSIVIATGVHFTSDAVNLAADNNIDVVFLDSFGAPTSRIWQTRMGSTTQIRRRQLEVCETPESLQFVKEWVAKKISNQVDFLAELQRRRSAASSKDSPFSCLGTITRSRDDILQLNGNVDDVRDRLMGLEGAAGRAYFGCLGKIVPSDYQFSSRSRQPAKDPFNAMLNYGYGVLYSLVERAQILAGLDPHIGFLHTDNYNKPSLVYDMIEPFRIIAERATTLFFTGRRVKKDFFREVPGGIELAPDGRAALIENLNERLDKSVRYPVQRPKQRGAKKYRNIKLRATIQHEAHALANRLLGKDDIPKIVDASELFDEASK